MTFSSETFVQQCTRGRTLARNPSESSFKSTRSTPRSRRSPSVRSTNSTIDASGFPASLKGVHLDTCLSKGAFGELWKAGENYGDRTFLLKKQQTTVVESLNYMDNVKREISILYSLDHPRIVKLLFDFSDSQFICLGMEYVSGGSLKEKLVKFRGQPLPLQRSLTYFHELCEALEYCHGREPVKVIHRDVKPDHLMITGDDHVKLTDFGWANMLQEEKLRETFVGTLDYIAPEMSSKMGHNEKVDVWSAGVLLYELSIGRTPFTATSYDATCRRILEAKPEFPAGFHTDVKAIIEMVLVADPSSRPQISAVMSHEIFSKLSEDMSIEATGLKDDSSPPVSMLASTGVNTASASPTMSSSVTEGSSLAKSQEMTTKTRGASKKAPKVQRNRNLGWLLRFPAMFRTSSRSQQ